VGGTPEAFAEHIRREREKWSRVVRDAGIVAN
jgi:tripartite-type tricarboxylate transporter receptor subunit TctC